MIDVSIVSANPKFACTGERIIQKTPRIWAGGNSTRLFTNPLTVWPLVFTASLPKQKHSRAKSRQLRRLTVEQIPRLGDVQVHVRLSTATGKLILNVNHRKAPINVQLMSFYQIHQRKSAISNISTYLSGPEVFHKPARVVTNTV